VGTSKGKRPPDRSRLLRESNIILILLKELEGGAWTELWWLWEGSVCGNYSLTSFEKLNFSRDTLIHAVKM